MKPAAIAVLFLCIAGSIFAGEPLTAQQTIDKIKEKSGVEWSANTVDTFKAGDPNLKVTGVTTTMFPTLEVIKKSLAAGNNLVICHEPTFYNHKDDLGPLEKDDVQMAKLKFIRENNMAVFRFHDHWHRVKPDGIATGVAEQLGWLEKRRTGDQNIYDLEPTTVGELAKSIKAKLNAKAVRVVGDPAMVCSKIGLSPGASATVNHFLLLQRDDVEVLACGEAREWETVEYVRDAITSGKKKALILIGHSPSEEPGMDRCAKWLGGFLTVPVKFIPCGDPFWLP